jgi:hypothetical protein
VWFAGAQEVEIRAVEEEDVGRHCFLMFVFWTLDRRMGWLMGSDERELGWFEAAERD